MNRRDFFKRFALAAPAIAVAPQLLAVDPIFKPNTLGVFEQLRMPYQEALNISLDDLFAQFYKVKRAREARPDSDVVVVSKVTLDHLSVNG